MSSSNENTVRLTIETSDPATEIYVVDSAFRLVANRGLGTWSENIPLGLYRVKVQAGHKAREEFLYLDGTKSKLLDESSPEAETLASSPKRPARLQARSDEVRLTFPRLRFASAAPLADTRQTHEYHQTAAAMHSQQVDVRLGEGAQVFFFARTWNQQGETLHPGAQSPLLRRISLRDLEGKPLVDLAKHATSELRMQEPWSACNIQLEPGAYRLRFKRNLSPALEQMLFVPRDWQMQVFLLLRDRTEPDYHQATLLMSRRGTGFVPDTQDKASFRMTELARMGLERRRTILAPQELEQLLDSKFENPLLGIYGGHLLLLERPRNVPLLRRVIRNLRDLLGAHPDVEALALAIGDPLEFPEVFRHPPMLASSWPIIVQATESRRELVPPDSLSARIAERLWGAGPWLLWMKPKPLPSQKAEPGGFQEMARQIQRLGQERPLPLARLSSPQHQLLVRLARSEPSAGEFPLSVESLHSSEPPEAEELRLIRDLGLPAATLQELMSELVDKLSRPIRGSTQRSQWETARAKPDFSALDPAFSQGLWRLKRAVLRCSAWSDKLKAWEAVERLEPQVREALLSQHTAERQKECLSQWNSQWSQVRTELETPGSRSRLVSELPSLMDARHTDVDDLVRGLEPEAWGEEGPHLDIEDAYGFLRELIEHFRQELSHTLGLPERKKKRVKRRLTSVVRTTLLGLGAMSTGIRMGVHGASAFWLGVQALRTAYRQLSEPGPAHRVLPLPAPPSGKEIQPGPQSPM